VTETEFQALVVDLAHLTGWQTMHVRPAQTANGRHLTPTTCVGWPDLTLWRPGQHLIRELKTDRGRLTPAQADVLDSLRLAGIDADVWRPRDWDAINRTLRATRPATPLETHR
jgi:hypothetical protein